MKIPGLPGAAPSGGDGGEGGGDAGPQALSYGEEPEELPEYNFIEVLNNSTDPLSTDSLTIEIQIPAGQVVTVSLPPGLTAPAGGFIVFSAEDHRGGTECFRTG